MNQSTVIPQPKDPWKPREVWGACPPVKIGGFGFSNFFLEGLGGLPPQLTPLLKDIFPYAVQPFHHVHVLTRIQNRRCHINKIYVYKNRFIYTLIYMYNHSYNYKKKLLFICPEFHGYEKVISDALLKSGYDLKAIIYNEYELFNFNIYQKIA